MSLLLRAILAVEQVDDVITLSGGALWPDMRSGVLFVRSMYKELWECVLKRGEGDDVRGAAIIGTPGSES